MLLSHSKLQKSQIEKVRKYRLLLKKYFDLDKVYLFGTYAKETNREDSDLDVAIIVNSCISGSQLFRQ